LFFSSLIYKIFFYCVKKKDDQVIDNTDPDEKCASATINASNIGENLTDIYKNLSRILNNTNTTQTTNHHSHTHHQNHNRTTAALNINKINIPKSTPCLYVTNEINQSDEEDDDQVVDNHHTASSSTTSPSSFLTKTTSSILSAADAPSLTTISSMCQAAEAAAAAAASAAAAAASASSSTQNTKINKLPVKSVSGKLNASIVTLNNKSLKVQQNKLVQAPTLNLNQLGSNTKVYYNNKIYSNGKLIDVSPASCAIEKATSKTKTIKEVSLLVLFNAFKKSYYYKLKSLQKPS
jgi:hypothetical protein